MGLVARLARIAPIGIALGAAVLVYGFFRVALVDIDPPDDGPQRKRR